jgi:P27 family predicted phage terminase small subunit
MGKRGPLPKTKASRMLSGTEPITKEATEALNKPFDPPIGPSHFSIRETRVWVETVNLLRPMKVLERVDQAVLAAYCCSYIRWQDAEKEIAKATSPLSGLVLKDKKGRPRATNPLVIISRDAQKDMIYYAAQLGMTPASRLKMVSPGGKDVPENPFTKLKLGNNDAQLDADRKGLRQVIDAQGK